MAARKKDTQINLIPEVGFAATTTGRILTWMLSSFRIIVIVTEIIVMIAFLSRFWLDARNTDLNEQILQKQAVIAASSNFEKEFKFTQKRLQIFSELESEKGILSDTLDTITLALPPDVFLISINSSSESLALSGLSPNERSIQQFMANLSSSDQIHSVKLQGIKPSPDEPTLMIFKIELLLKDESQDIV
jgi:Tfp pilus assembly protein PilN